MCEPTSRLCCKGFVEGSGLRYICEAIDPAPEVWSHLAELEGAGSPKIHHQDQESSAECF